MTFISCCVLVPLVQPSVPVDVEPKEPDYLEDTRAGRFIIPEGIRPVLKEFRIEVHRLLLHWLSPQAAPGWWAGLVRESTLELKCACEA